jgi:hypothetical protein
MIGKLLHIALAGIIFFSTSGFAISQHYCGDHLISVFVNSEDEPCCGQDSSCCHNETDYKQLDSPVISPVEQKISDVNSEFLYLFSTEELSADRHTHQGTVSLFQDSISPPLTPQQFLASLQSYLL